MANDREIKIIISADGTAAIAGIRSVEGATEKLGSTSALDSFKKNWLAVTAGITGAYLAFQQIWGLMDKAAEQAEKMQTLDSLTQRFGTTAQGLVGIIEQNSRGLIGVGAAASVAADALAKGFNPDQVAQMANIAAVMHKTSTEGMSASEAFKSLEGSITAARERGVVRMMGAEIDLASSMGARFNTMSKVQKAQELLNEVSERAAKVERALGDEYDSNADKIQRFRNQIEALKLTLGDYLLQIAAGLLATFQSVDALVLGLTRVIMAPITALMLATDYLGITKGKAEEYMLDMEALADAGVDLAEKANANFKIAMGENDKAAKGTGEALGGNAGANVKQAEQLAELMRKIREAQTLAEAAEIDKSRIQADAWFDEQVKKLRDLGASNKEYSELVVAYAAKRHVDLSAWATKTSDFYLAVQRENAKENDEIEKARNAALFKTAEDGVKERLAMQDTYAKAGDTETESDAIRRKAAGEREILAIQQEGLVTSITEQTTFADTLKIMEEYAVLQNQVEASKRVEVTDLDARRLAIEREITDLNKQQRDMVAEMQIRYAQDALNKIGAGSAADLTGTARGISAGVDPYTKDYDLWAAGQGKRIQHLIEQGATEASLKNEYRQYDLMQEQMLQQQKLAMASSGFGMMAGMMQSFYAASGNQNKAAFALYKTFAIGQTVIDTYRAAQGAYAALAGIPIVGPALGIAAAAAAIAAGMARVQAIQSAQPGGGMSVSGGSGGVPALATTGSAGAAKPAETVISPVVNIYLQGDGIFDDSALDKFARQIGPSLTKAYADGIR